MRCTRLAANTGRKKVAKNRHLGPIAQLCRANTSSTCPDNMVNFGPLTAEIGSGVWGTPTNFNGFCVLAASSSGRQLNFAALNRGRHLCSAGRPLGWALAHILVLSIFFFSSPNRSHRRLDVCHTSTHGVALVRISDGGLKRAAHSSLQI